MNDSNSPAGSGANSGDHFPSDPSSLQHDQRQQSFRAAPDDATSRFATTPAPQPQAGIPTPPASNTPSGRSRLAMLGAAVMLVIGLLTGGAAGGAIGYEIGQDHADSNGGATATQTSPAAADTIANENEATPTGEASPPAEEDAELSLSDLVAQVNPAVVTVEASVRGGNDIFGQPQSGTSTGSGFIIDEQGHVVTNNHVVEGADSVSVTFSDGTEVDATVIGTDPFQDIAVLKIAGDVPATVPFGDSDEVRAGDPVVAIGSALGEFNNTVTNGIVSATDRSLDTGEGYRLGNLIQHNAPISPGNSGGPLLNDQGEVIGMNTAVVRGSGMGAGAEGLGFAVASNTIEEIAEQIIADGSPERPYLGISFADARSVDPRLDGGVVLQEVSADGPAGQAGLEAGDIITAVNGTQIDDEHPFLNLVYDHQPGDSITFTVRTSDGATNDVQVTLGERPA